MKTLIILDLGDSVNLNHVADMVRKQRTVSVNEFEIFRDDNTNNWHVLGSGLQRFVQMTNWRYAFIFISMTVCKCQNLCSRM